MSAMVIVEGKNGKIGFCFPSSIPTNSQWEELQKELTRIVVKSMQNQKSVTNIDDSLQGAS